MKTEKEPNEDVRKEVREEADELDELLPLLRLLLREPPEGHDFKTCPICRRWGITHI